MGITYTPLDSALKHQRCKYCINESGWYYCKKPKTKHYYPYPCTKIEALVCPRCK